MCANLVHTSVPLLCTESGVSADMDDRVRPVLHCGRRPGFHNRTETQRPRVLSFVLFERMLPAGKHQVRGVVDVRGCGS